jgi:hypothetical protein
MAALRPIATAVINSGAPVMIGTVAIVALMQIRRKPPMVPGSGVDLAEIEAPQRPPFAVALNKQVKWTPDTSFKKAFAYFTNESGQRVT